jgi:hypothetical protein
MHLFDAEARETPFQKKIKLGPSFVFLYVFSLML